MRAGEARMLGQVRQSRQPAYLVPLMSLLLVFVALILHGCAPPPPVALIINPPQEVDFGNVEARITRSTGVICEGSSGIIIVDIPITGSGYLPLANPRVYLTTHFSIAQSTFPRRVGEPGFSIAVKFAPNEETGPLSTTLAVEIGDSTTTVELKGRGVCQEVDSDSDGWTDGQEEILGTDPNNPDTDEDGVEDRDDKEPLNPDVN